MTCNKCGKKIEESEDVIEIASGYKSGDFVTLHESLAVLCMVCEEKVMPALWKEIAKHE